MAVGLQLMDFILAHSRYRRRKLESAIAVCDSLLQKNSKDEAAWMLKCQCLIKENYVDELETEEEGIAELMVKEQDSNTLARPGTSFRSPAAGNNPIMRPLNSGRVATGFQRAGTSVGSRAASRNNGMLRTGRVMTKGGVPTTSNGRILRLSTASLQQHGQNFFDSNKADLRKIAARRSKARLIFQYLFYVEHNIRKSLELASYATEANNYEDPWWKLALGKCYYQLGFLKEGEKQLLSSVKHNNNIEAYLYLSRICEKQDDVEGSLAALRKAQEVHPNEPRLDIALGRVYDQLQEAEKAHEYYKRALAVENCNAEAVANIAAYYFYKDQPEISLKMYQRLVELGCESVEIWNNMALCCFGNHQYHLYYTCFQRALLLAQDHPDLHADVWYNIGYVYAQFGELEMAGVAFRVALGLQPDHPEALGNVAVVEARQGRVEAAINYAEKSYRESANFEAAYNLSLWYLQTNQLEKASEYNRLALGVFPGHAESRALAGRLLRKLEAL